MQRGYILVPVVLALLLIALVAVLSTTESSLHANETGGVVATRQAEHLALSGLSHARWRTTHGACRGDYSVAPAALGGGSYVATATGGAPGSVLTLDAEADAWIRSDDTDRNNGTATWNHVRLETGRHEQVLVRFDLTPLAANAQILGATAWFHLKAGKDHLEGPIGIHPIQADWDETTVTWDSFAGQYDPVRLGVIPAQDVGDVWVGVNLTAQVQAWVHGQPNHGVLLLTESEGVHTEYSAREDGSHAPRLEVIVGAGPPSPIALVSTGSHAHGIVRTANRPALTALQPAATVTLRPGPGEADDTYLWEANKTTNYGADNETWVATGNNNAALALFRFGLGAIPSDARILDARLSLHHRSGNDPDVPVTAHRMTRAWDEAAATWNRRESGTNWDTAGGDFDPVAVSTTSVGPATFTRYEWDVTRLVRGWLGGHYPNHGVALRTEAPGIFGERFDTSDHLDPTRRPSLTIRYACPCGAPCLAPQSAGDLLMVIGGSPANPAPSDVAIRDTLEDWGYTVALIQGDDSQGNFNAAAAAADVAFVSESVAAPNVGTKLTGFAIGVVSAERQLNDELGIADSGGTPVGDSIEVLDNAHYITAVFPTGPRPFKTVATELASATGALAPGARVLAQSEGAPSVVALDTGAIMAGGGPSAGRRVLVPVGDAGVPWHYLTNDGELVVQRALAWAQCGAGCNVDAPTPELVLVVADAASPTPNETAKRDLIESWGYSVALLSDEAGMADYDDALTDAVAAYVSGEADAAAIGKKLRATPVGVVNELIGLHEGLGFSQSADTNTFNRIFVVDNAHSITEGFATGWLTVALSDQPLQALDGVLAPGLQTLATVWINGANYQDGLMAVEIGAPLFDGDFAAGRRVQLPWGAHGFDFAALSDAGETIMRRAIEWAAGAAESTGPRLWVSTQDDVTASGVPGLEAWTDGEALTIGDPGLLLEPAVSGGSFASALDLDAFAADGNADLDAIHVVDNALTLGAAPAFDLVPGDLLLSTADNESFSSLSAATVNDEDVFVFRPAMPGDYSSGEFFVLLDGSQVHDEADTVGISLLEQDTSIGDLDLLRGSFLVALSNRRDVIGLRVDGVGAGTTAGSLAELVDGPSLDFGSEIRGIEFAEDAVAVGGQVLPAGAVLLTLNHDDPGGVGDNRVPVDSADVFYLTVTQAGGSPEADATLLFEGADANLDTTAEHLQALALAPSVASDGGGGNPIDPPGSDRTVRYAGFAEIDAGATYDVDVPTPTGAAAGDLLIAAVASDGGATDLVASDGWTPLGVEDSGGRVTLGLWWRIAGSSEPASHRFASARYEMKYGWMMRFTGHDAASPIAAVSSFASGRSETPPVPATTTAVDHTLVLRLGAFDDADVEEDAPGLPGHTPITMDVGGDGRGAVSGGAGYAQQASAGSTGTSAFELDGREEYVTITLAIAPAR